MSQSRWNADIVDEIRFALLERGDRTLLVQGPPGSGKTWLTVRLALDAAAGMDSSQSVLVLTFTVNAADQIGSEQRRARDEYLDLGSRVSVLNYHAFYRQLIDAYVRYVDVPDDWRLWSPHEVDATLRPLNDETYRAYESHDRATQWTLSNATSIAEGLMERHEEAKCSCSTLHDADQVLRAHYRDGLLHYDSWPFFAYSILSRSRTIAESIARRYPLVIVDEFQDTNGIEWAFIRELTRSSVLVCMADPNQAVYSFKGADPDERLASLRRERGLVPASEFCLTEQPRMKSPHLCEVAEAVRRCSHKREPVSQVPGCDDFRVIGVRRQKGESPGIADGEWPLSYAAQVKQIVRGASSAKDRYGVLCPTHALLGGVSLGLMQGYGGAPLPHSIVGLETEAGAFVGALTHVLTALLDADARQEEMRMAELALESMRRNRPEKGRWFGDDACDPISNTDKRRRDGIRDLLSGALERHCPSSSPLEYVTSLAGSVRAAASSGQKHSFWIAEPSLDRAVRLWSQNLRSFLSRNPQPSSRDMVAAAWRGVMAAVAYERRFIVQSRVALMTAHAAKGKQFTHTIVCGASEGTRHVHARQHSDCDGVRRLIYVACTRSEKKVHVLHRDGSPCCIIDYLGGRGCPLKGKPIQCSLGI